MNFVKFLVQSILKNMVHFYRGLKVLGLDCMTASDFSIRVTGLVVFELASLILKHVLTCIRKPKTNTFDKSITFLHWLFLIALDGFRSL